MIDAAWVILSTLRCSGSNPAVSHIPPPLYSRKKINTFLSGCDVSRLRDFVSDFFSQHTASLTQNVDEAYLVFVWSLIVQQPTVRIGVVPPGVPTEVFVAPQNNKTKARDGDTEPAQVTQLDIIPEAKSKSLAELKIQYGDTLRIAVNGESSFVAITGLHHRVSFHHCREGG